MSIDLDRDIFYFDISALDWKDYTEVYVQVGLCEAQLKDPPILAYYNISFENYLQ
jgi:hypothetical protein